MSGFLSPEEATDALRAAGVTADICWAHTGGGCGTLEIGADDRDEERPYVSVGPGSYHASEMHFDELFVGPTDWAGVTEYTEMAGDTVSDLPALVAAVQKWLGLLDAADASAARRTRS